VSRTGLGALLALVAVAAPACGSDLGPGSTPAAVPVRIQLDHADSQMAAGVRDAIEMIGAREVGSAQDADLVVAGTEAAANAAARVNPGTHILLVGVRPLQPVASNVRVVEYDRGALAYLAGALAALSGREVAVAERGSVLAQAFRAGVAAARRPATVTSAGCGGSTTAAVVYVPDASCRPDAPDALVIAPQRLAGARMLALLGPRPAVVVADTARSVQDGIFQAGIYLEGLRDDAIGFSWVSPAVAPAAFDRLQSIEDTVRAETAPVPTVAP
jgi:hypothetical protein